MSYSHRRFVGQYALVTGGASGIGLATVNRLAMEGASVLLSDWHRKRGAEAAETLSARGLDVRFVPHDAGDEASWVAVEDQLLAEFGCLHLLVNNAYSGVAANLNSLAPRILRDSMRVNVEGTVLGMQLASRLMTTGGAIVNLASIAAFAPNLENLGYSTAKLAAVHLTQSAALSLSQKSPSIRVNAIAPGPTDTHALRATLRALNGLSKDADLGSAMRDIADRVPLRRVGSVGEIAAAIAFLLSDEASFISGHCICVDGGASIA